MASSSARSDSPAGPLGPARFALVVLGCPVRRVEEVEEGTGRRSALAGALGRRVRRAATEWGRAAKDEREDGRPAVLVATGGRAWDGAVEADAMAEALVDLGVPAGVIVRERASLHTRDNARFTAAVCARRGIGRVALVTCGWHLPRATMCFEAEGLVVVRQVSAGDLVGGWGTRAWVLGKERVLRVLTATGTSAT
jgi:uncharacterized SAM-binding protein YcdF (DUF218 family)